jgi:tRNA dimethylallyltransferase
MGPTASGKTDLAIELCQRLNGEVISVDSALIYREMDIGTAKPTMEERAAAPHHLIDICDPSEHYSAAEFCRDAKRLIDDCYARGKWPILAGGTMLYFKALLHGLADLPATDPATREAVNQKLKQQGPESLHAWLAEFDQETAARLHPTDSQRLSRAIEVYLVSGKPLSQWHREQALKPLPYPQLQLAIAPNDRAVLHRRIEQRFDKMLEQGFVQEVEQLFKRGDLDIDKPSIRCVGYRQIWLYLNGEYSLDEARYRGIVATRQLAKRQLTWLRSWSELLWLDTFDAQKCDKVLKRLGIKSF